MILKRRSPSGKIVCALVQQFKALILKKMSELLILLMIPNKNFLFFEFLELLKFLLGSDKLLFF